MPLFTINAADIDAAGRSLEADLPVAWLDAQLGEANLRGAAPGHLSARLSRSAGDVVVRGKVRASLATACARCLEQANIDVDTELALLLRPDPSILAAEKAAKAAAKAASSPAGSAKGKAEAARGAEAGKSAKAGKEGKGGKGGKREKEGPEYEFSSDEADVDAYDGETVVLDDFVREAILLEIPIFPLCSESCPGIRPASPDVADGRGEAPPIDPRLAPLGALRAGLAKSAKDAPRSSGSNDDQGPAANGADAPHEKKTKKE